MAKKISETQTLVKKELRSIPPDGRCFWYAWISCTTADEWWTIDRSKLGYAKCRGRLKTEEAMGEALLTEVMDKLISNSATPEMTKLCEEVKDGFVDWNTCEIPWWYKR